MAIGSSNIFSLGKVHLIALAMVSVAVSTGTNATDELDKFDDPIKLGMSTALSGPAKGLGENMKTGVEIAIAEINADGGIQGRSIELIALDDGYEPSRTVPNMHQLITESQVLAVVGNVGTPTAVAAIPISNEYQVPFYGAFTGAGVLRKTPPDRYVINYRSSYAQETAAMIDALITHVGFRPEEIAFFTQRDAYGDAGYTGGMDALRAHGLKDESVIAHGRYQRNTIAVENGLADIMQAPTKCKAVIMVGAYAPCAEFIKMARAVGMDSLFLNVSFVGGGPLAHELEGVDARVIVTQVVPPPMSDMGVVTQYREAMRVYSSELQPTYGALEGYLAMQVFRQVLEGMEGEITRESVIDAMEAMGEFEIDEMLAMSLSPTDHQASDQIWATMIEGGQVVPIEWSWISAMGDVVLEESVDD